MTTANPPPTQAAATCSAGTSDRASFSSTAATMKALRVIFSRLAILAARRSVVLGIPRENTTRGGLRTLLGWGIVDLVSVLHTGIHQEYSALEHRCQAPVPRNFRP